MFDSSSDEDEDEESDESNDEGNKDEKSTGELNVRTLTSEEIANSKLLIQNQVVDSKAGINQETL